jgi:predicted RNase H-like HicB family nuclease
MLTSYIRAAMRQTRYEIVEDDGSFYGEIPAIPGVWANAKILKACREQLESVLEGWLVVTVADHSPIPEIDGHRIEVTRSRLNARYRPIKRRDLIAIPARFGLRAACIGRRSPVYARPGAASCVFRILIRRTSAGASGANPSPGRDQSRGMGSALNVCCAGFLHQECFPDRLGALLAQE